MDVQPQSLSHSGLPRAANTVMQRVQRLLGRKPCFELHGIESRRRQEVESSVAACFAIAHQATVSEFAPLLLEQRCGGVATCIAGVRPAGGSALLLERYLDQPIEAVIAARIGVAVRREGIVEIGNFASLKPGASQLMIYMLAVMLGNAGFGHACFAGTDQVIRLVRKLNIPAFTVALADPARLGKAAAQWGRYYDSCPEVLVVDIAGTLEVLREQRLAGIIQQQYQAVVNRFATVLARPELVLSGATALLQ